MDEETLRELNATERFYFIKILLDRIDEDTTKDDIVNWLIDFQKKAFEEMNKKGKTKWK